MCGAQETMDTPDSLWILWMPLTHFGYCGYHSPSTEDQLTGKIFRISLFLLDSTKLL